MSISGYSPNMTGYSPADFADSEETRPTELLLDPTSTGSRVPYSTVVHNAAQRQMMEIRDKTISPNLGNQSWRRKMKEFLAFKNEKLIEFLPKPFPQHPVLSQADQFLRRFGRLDFQPTSANLREVCLDISGVPIAPAIEEELQKQGPSDIKQLGAQIRYVWDAYREAGEAVLSKEAALSQKLSNLDRVYQKVCGILDVPVNSEHAALTTSVEKYVEVAFDENQIEEAYKDLMEAYRRFVYLKDMVGFLKTTEPATTEPLCSICIQEPVSFALVPCGHTFCLNCSRRQTMQCYICRANIRERTKIFFG